MPLGAAREWLAEWLVFGAVLGGGVPLLAVAGIIAVEGPPPNPYVLATIASFGAVGAFTGAIVAVLCAAPARALATVLWTRVHPVTALLLGPFVGAATGAVLGVVLVAGPMGETSTRFLTAAALIGAACAGITFAPVWVAYVALRARGRRGWGALGVALVWTPLTVAATLATLFWTL